MTLILFGVFFLLVFLNIPIAVSLGLTAMIGLYVGGFPFSMFPNVMYASIGKFALLAIPFFVLAGSIMEYAGISQRLVNFARTCVGHRKSGMLAVTGIVCCFFAAISGSGPATVAALGTILIPAMVHQGYDRGTSTALLSASGAIGIIIPPSIAFVVYASCTDTSVGALFSAGIIPGILVGISYLVAAMIATRKNEVVMLPKASAAERWAAFKEAFWALLMPVIILGGIFGGIFTPTESAAVAVVYALLVSLLIYKDIKIKDIPGIFVDGAISTATILLLVGISKSSGYVITTSGLPHQVLEVFSSFTNSTVVILLLLNILFLVIGMLMEANAAIIMMTPILLPLLDAFGIDPLQFGIMMSFNLCIGLVTPPVGICLLMTNQIAGARFVQTLKSVLPMLLIGIVVLMLVTYIPQVTTFLPGLIK